MAQTPRSAPSNRWMPRIPPPLQRLFDRFPLVTYEANELPSRAPGPSSLPMLYVFASEEDARRGAPSFNPTCLKWQAFLKLANVQFLLVPSTNHASPTGALPFLLPPRGAPSSTPIPSNKLHAYATSHNRPGANVNENKNKNNRRQGENDDDDYDGFTPRTEAYQSLLDGPIRNAWLHALYLDAANAALLSERYAVPASSVAPVRAALLRKLRLAAAAEIRKTVVGVPGSGPGLGLHSESPEHDDSDNGNDNKEDGNGGGIFDFDLRNFDLDFLVRPPLDASVVYDEARAALLALEQLVAESSTGWFFSAPRAALFDCAVFAYVHLMVVDERAHQHQHQWDGKGKDEGSDRLSMLGHMLRGVDIAGLRAHHRRTWELLWPGFEIPGLLGADYRAPPGLVGREMDEKRESERSEESEGLEEIVMTQSLMAAR